ncbi:hypothetical protein [Citrobacter amalonaticus]|nr:hypothetical protein [Citrobacter amalonaticus]
MADILDVICHLWHESTTHHPFLSLLFWFLFWVWLLLFHHE